LSKKVTYIISNIDRWIAFEWIIENIDKERIELSFILINSNKSYFEQYLKDNCIKYCQFDYHSKNQLPILVIRIARVLKKFNTKIVHTHFLDANLIGLIAAKISGIKNRIHTRHHSVFHHEYAKRGVFIDKFCNKLSTKIVSISAVVSKVLINNEQVDPRKIVLIHHGFDIDKFNLIDEIAVNNLEVKYRLDSKYPVIGVVSRFIEWKGVQYTIEAFKQILKQYPDAILVLANARGPHSQSLKERTKDIPERNLKFIKFEEDLFSLYQLFDAFVHVPISSEVEAFGQIYIEALAAGVPSIFTLSGIAHSFIKHEENAVVVPFKNSEAIYQGILRLLNDKNLAGKLIKNGEKDVRALFELDKMIDKLNNLYSN